MTQPVIVCLDMEGVLLPEIWLAVAEKTGIPDLHLTTRDIPDYDELMTMRLTVLRQNSVTLQDIQNVTEELHPLDGASNFLHWLRERSQVVILSDTFYEFVNPLMKQLDYPTIFCHTLQVDQHGFIAKYVLRQRDQKRHAVHAFKSIGFRVLSAGDSYNDISMLQEADAGMLFSPPDSIREEFPQFPVAQTYTEFRELLLKEGNFSH